MKTPHQCVEEMLILTGCPVDSVKNVMAKSPNETKAMVDLLNQFLLEYFKAGMSEAAGMCIDNGKACPLSALQDTCNQLGKAILAARDAKTEL